jgi:hypothetical protein
VLSSYNKIEIGLISGCVFYRRQLYADHFCYFQGVSAVNAFYELLSQGSLSVKHPETRKLVAPVELCPILKTLYKILIKRFGCSWTITAKEFFGTITNLPFHNESGFN